MRRLILPALLLAANPALAWKISEAGKPFTHKGSGYSVQFPPHWKYDKLWFSDESGATRDGPGLQSIFVDFRAHKTAFRAIKKGSSESALTQDLAADLIADMTKERDLENVQILADEPTTLAGRPAFRLQIEYKSPVVRGAVRYREIIVGTVNAKGLYLIGYRAPVLHYFARDTRAFEASLASFSIADNPVKGR